MAAELRWVVEHFRDDDAEVFAIYWDCSDENLPIAVSHSEGAPEWMTLETAVTLRDALTRAIGRTTEARS